METFEIQAYNPKQVTLQLMSLMTHETSNSATFKKLETFFFLGDIMTFPFNLNTNEPADLQGIKRMSFV